MTVSVALPPSAMLNAVNEASPPVVCERSGHGSRPARAASPGVQKSPPTMHSACLNSRTTAPAIEGAPTAGAARMNTSATRAMAPMYSMLA